MRADIKYKGGKYVLLNEGYLGHLKNTYPLTAYDMAIILTTLMQAAQSHNIFSFTKRKC